MLHRRLSRPSVSAKTEIKKSHQLVANERAELLWLLEISEMICLPVDLPYNLAKAHKCSTDSLVARN